MKKILYFLMLCAGFSANLAMADPLIWDQGLWDANTWEAGGDVEWDDSDGDTVLNFNDPDDDNDGLSDTFEIANNLDPLDASDANGDADGDGVTNAIEQMLGTDVNSVDSDGDGINDNVDNQPLIAGQSTDVQFTYTFDGSARGDAGVVITGIIQGMLQADNDTLEILAFRQVSLAGHQYQITDAIGIQSILPGNPAQMSLSGEVLDFWVCVQGFSQTLDDGNGDCPFGAEGGFLFTQDGLGTITEPWAIAGIPELGDSYRNSDIPLNQTNWQAQIVAPLDTDADGLPDNFETANNLDPTDAADSAADSDGDGLSNYEEYLLGTNVNLADSDGDGINDAEDNQPLIFGESSEFEFSYTFDGSQRGETGFIITGVIDGMLQSDDDTIEIITFKQVSLAGHDYQISDSIGIQAILPGNTPRMSLSGEVLDFWVCVQGFSQIRVDDNGDCPFGAEGGFLFSLSGLDDITQPWALAGIPELGDSYRNSDIPLNPANWHAQIIIPPVDTDQDGLPDDIDTDDDNDGIDDVNDEYPLIAIGNYLDTDGDGAPDECDTACVSLGMAADHDDDNDGVLDVDDAYPLDPEKWQDMVKVKKDLNGDGKADILWRNRSTGQNWLWTMNGRSIIKSAGINKIADQAWQIVGRGDFDGDGMSDILWRNSNSGRNYIFLMDGFTIKQAGQLNYVTDLGWQVAEVADFDGDGKDDVLWRHASKGTTWIYLMNGMKAKVSKGSLKVADLNWQIVASGDVNGDGRADVIWRHATRGDNYIWLMNGSSIGSKYVLNRVSSSTWTIAGSGDINGDGTDDIIWRNQNDGRNWAYLMNGGQIQSSKLINKVANTNWQIADISDLDGDGDADLFWREMQSGKNYIYLMNGLSISSSGYSKSVSTSWQVLD